jgi:RimJ/RimL family protein N-acetyltransferase
VDLQPTLEGTLVTLRPLRAEDFDELYRAASDPKIWEQHPEPDRFQREVFDRYFEGAMKSGGAFAIVDRRTGNIIGSSRFHDLTPDGKEIEIGWTFLERRFWGGRYNGEVKRLMLDHAFRVVQRVVFTVGPKNLRSQTALLKIGAKRIGEVDREDRHGNPRRDVRFAIDRDGWLAKSRPPSTRPPGPD